MLKYLLLPFAILIINPLLFAESAMFIDNHLFLSNIKNAFYYWPERKIFINYPGYDSVAFINEGSDQVVSDGKIVLRLMKKPLIFKNTPFFFYDDYLKIWGRLPSVKKFLVISPYTRRVNCFTTRYTPDLSDLIRFSKRKSKITIVIDPGHGGEDSGAKGPWCHLEKDLVFQVAALVVNYLGKKTPYRIVMTRYGDYYITLRDRSKMANSLNASVFVSIHANAAPRPTAEGVETFILALNPVDEEAKHVAALENKWARETGEFSEEKSVKRIVNDLLQSRITMKSAMLARFIHKNILSLTGSFNRKIRKANFWVLLGTKMPSVLVEIGFISNEVEERKLFDYDYQRKIAEGIADGIIEFLKKERRDEK